MQSISPRSSDLNLLTALYALLAEQNVTRAAARLHLSVPATSRTLERCRRTFGDPLLVRHGRGVVITPRGIELLAELGPVIESIENLFAPATFDPALLDRSFVIRANEAVISAVGSTLVEIVAGEAPAVELRYALESADDLDALRAGYADLAIGSYSEIAGDLVIEHVADEQLVGLVRAGHAALGRRLTLARFASLDHVVTSRRGLARGPLDQYLADRGRQRRIAAVVPSFAAALAICAQSNATTIAPRRLATVFADMGGLALFDPPVPLPTVEVTQVWHGRFSNDPAHQWLRGCVGRAASRLRPAAAT